VAHLRRHEVGDIGISTITLAELEFGVWRSSDPTRNKVALMNFCASMEIIPFDASAAKKYGHLRAWLQKVGMPMGLLDMLIAAHALCLDVKLVTNNEREFRRVVGLSVENWAKD
jgi:tRNA(fMet)-specific endonuclease VapC